MKVGLLFGSFNPVHTGHLIIASCVANFYADEVWFILSPQNPFKPEITLLAEKERWKLLQAAIDNDERFKAIDIELSMPKPSYTTDTLIALKVKFKNHSFSLVVGSDNYPSITNWKSGSDILKDFNILVYQRPNFVVNQDVAKNHTIVDGPLLDISATAIRKLIGENKNVNYLLPEKVIEIINQNNLYK